jgi:hypothetical protein
MTRQALRAALSKLVCEPTERASVCVYEVLRVRMRAYGVCAHWYVSVLREHICVCVTNLCGVCTTYVCL